MNQSDDDLLTEIGRHYRRQPGQLTKQTRLEQALLFLIEDHCQDGQRLPSHRKLCRELGVARNTLAGVIDALVREGHLVTDHGRGTWVRKTGQGGAVAVEPRRLSNRARKVMADVGASQLQTGAFLPGVPDILQFPMAKWRHLYSRITVAHNTLLLSYSSGGYGPLKRAIAGFLKRWRGIDCELEQIIITEGAHHGMQLCALALADSADRVVMDSPFYWGARNVFAANGLEIDHAIWRPRSGYDNRLPSRGPQLLYLTGSHHYPLGHRRASAHKRWLVEQLEPAWTLEDDYEFGSDRSPDLLFDPEAADQVLIGSFSKLMFPGLRLGYLVVPRGLSPAINRLRSEIFREGRLLDQAVLATFIDDGALDAWCARMATEYYQRQQYLSALLEAVPGVRDISPPAGCISLSVQFAPAIDDDHLSRYLLNRHHLITRPLSAVCAPGDDRRGLVLGVGMIQGEALIEKGRRLAHGIETYLAHHAWDVRREV
ncbi:aminotransferase-like domain-containing protein [Salinicola rhizosphaerae]|uniref:GntR family transcriptional regulator n=1 Tax=Salinicola rhizosphaerae TaxID=1443141 RepID=A0ABQ3DSD4_9GAMM|nr:PLP-dependent aminotransferase family protein [Salinicola rhizosphaerae]GHB14259.1 GntR family transcriptional regulator [Salinicola rhizosphaerae]